MPRWRGRETAIMIGSCCVDRMAALIPAPGAGGSYPRAGPFEKTETAKVPGGRRIVRSTCDAIRIARVRRPAMIRNKSDCASFSTRGWSRNAHLSSACPRDQATVGFVCDIVGHGMPGLTQRPGGHGRLTVVPGDATRHRLRATPGTFLGIYPAGVENPWPGNTGFGHGGMTSDEHSR